MTRPPESWGLIDRITKLANETDEQFQQRKASLGADGHTALAMVYMHRNDLGNAVESRSAGSVILRSLP